MVGNLRSPAAWTHASPGSPRDLRDGGIVGRRGAEGEKRRKLQKKTLNPLKRFDREQNDAV
jgi:hypothetical protein